MFKQKSKLVLVLGLVFVVGIVSYLIPGNQSYYFSSSLLQDENYVSPREIEEHVKSGEVCYPTYEYQRTDCKKSKSGTSCKLETRKTDSYICHEPKETNEISSEQYGF